MLCRIGNVISDGEPIAETIILKIDYFAGPTGGRGGGFFRLMRSMHRVTVIWGMVIIVLLAVEDKRSGGFALVVASADLLCVHV